MENTRSYSDKELFNQIANEEANAFAAVFDLYFDKLKYSALKFLKSEFWAEEIVQEVFLHLWDHRSKLPEVEHPSAWLYRIVANKCINLIKRQELEVRAQYSFQLASLSTPSTVHNSYDLTLMRKLIREAVDQLPQQQRRAYLLKQEEGLSYKEIGERLGISRNTVHNHLTRSVQSIRKYLLEHGGISSLIFFLLFFDFL